MSGHRAPGDGRGTSLRWRRFLANLRAAPRRSRETMFRSGSPEPTGAARRSSSATCSSTFTRCACTAGACAGRRPWGLGIAAVSAFLITLVTGVLLMFYYKPYPDVAYQSIKDIHFVVPTGPVHPQHPSLGGAT